MTTTTEVIEPEIVGPAPVDPRAQSVAVPMRDGVRLATDVYLPAGAGLRLPTVLIRLPYDKSGRYTFMSGIAGYLNAYGFAVVVQDVRGKYRSEGGRVPFVNEAADGYDTLEWLTVQPWCSGRIGMLGDSYYGFTQWAAVASGHPALAAIVPRVTGSRFMDMFSARVVPKLPLYEWVLHTFSLAGTFVDPVLRVRPLAGYEGLPAAAAELVPTIQRMSRAIDDGTQIAKTFPDLEPAPNLTIPALFVGGWWDNLSRSQFDDWNAAQSCPMAKHQFLRVTTTDHEDFQLHEPDEAHADHEVDDDALVDYLPRLLEEPISFLHHYLSGATTRWNAPRVAFQVAYGARQLADRWPPVDTRAMTLWLDAAQQSVRDATGGRLSGAVPSEVTCGSWTHDPYEPVPYLVESEWGQLADLPDESRLHGRDDVATFTSEPQRGRGEIVGSVALGVTISADAPSTHVIARLLDVSPEGRARLIVEGAALIQTDAWPAGVEIRLGEAGYRMREGHRLRLAISASCYPLYLVHPGTDTNPWRPVSVARVGHAIHAGPGTQGWLRLTARGDVTGARPDA